MFMYPHSTQGQLANGPKAVETIKGTHRQISYPVRHPQEGFPDGPGDVNRLPLLGVSLYRMSTTRQMD